MVVEIEKTVLGTLDLARDQQFGNNLVPFQVEKGEKLAPRLVTTAFLVLFFGDREREHVSGDWTIGLEGSSRESFLVTEQANGRFVELLAQK